MSNIMMLAVTVGASLALFHLLFSLIMHLYPQKFINFVARIHHISEGPKFHTEVTFKHVVTGTIVHFFAGFIFILVTGHIYEFLFGMYGMR